MVSGELCDRVTHYDILKLVSGIDRLAEVNGPRAYAVLSRRGEIWDYITERSASSIPANIAEGQARRSTGEFVQSLGVARGSLAELETFLTLSTKLTARAMTC